MTRIKYAILIVLFLAGCNVPENVPAPQPQPVPVPQQNTVEQFVITNDTELPQTIECGQQITNNSQRNVTAQPNSITGSGIIISHHGGSVVFTNEVCSNVKLLWTDRRFYP